MILTWHHQRFFHSAECRPATHSKVPDLMWMWQFEEKKKDHRLIRATPSIQMFEISEWNRYTEVRTHVGSLHRIQSHVDGVRPTWMGWDSYNPQTLYLGSHVHSLRVIHLPDSVPGVTGPQSPGWHPLPDPAPGVARPLVRIPGLCWLGPYGGNEWVPITSWLGR